MEAKELYAEYAKKARECDTVQDEVSEWLELDGKLNKMVSEILELKSAVAERLDNCQAEIECRDVNL